MRSRSLLTRLLVTHLVVAGVTFGLLALTTRHIFDHPAALVLLVIGVAGISFMLSALIARSVAGPLGRIAQEVTHVAGGRFESVDPAGPAEARELATAVNTMAEQLAHRVDELRLETGLREQILGAMDEAVVLAENGAVVYVNPAARELLGAETGRPMPPQVARQSANDATVSEFAVHHPVYRDLRATSAPLPDGRLLVVAQDVTDARRIDRVRRDFVANASHEMKTPVAGILATAETLQHAIRQDPDAAERFARNLAKEADRLSNLIEDLLDLARLDQAQGHDDVVSFSGLVLQTIDELQPLAKAKGMFIETRLDEQVSLAGRSQDLALMIRNLLDNAIRYTAPPGGVSVDLRIQDDHAFLVIEDTGIGIPSKDLPRIFERFYRVDKGRARDTGGTGLGLAIVRHIAESHGGSVAAHSELGKGTALTVSLPLHQVDRPQAETNMNGT